MLVSCLLLTSLALGLAACIAGPTDAGSKPGPELSPLYNVTPDMLNPDGTFKKNGLLPIDPNDQI